MIFSLLNYLQKESSYRKFLVKNEKRQVERGLASPASCSSHSLGFPHDRLRSLLHKRPYLLRKESIFSC